MPLCRHGYKVGHFNWPIINPSQSKVKLLAICAMCIGPTFGQAKLHYSGVWCEANSAAQQDTLNHSLCSKHDAQSFSAVLSKAHVYSLALQTCMHGW